MGSTSKAGVTYICNETRNNAGAALVCHYNDGDISTHTTSESVKNLSGKELKKPDYWGYVCDPTTLSPSSVRVLEPQKWDPPLQVEGRYFGMFRATNRSLHPPAFSVLISSPECIVAPDPNDPSSTKYPFFVRWMINLEAKDVGRANPQDPKDAGTSDFGVGFPVGWAVRGYSAEVLKADNDSCRGDLRNGMNLLPVFRGDFNDLAWGGPGQDAQNQVQRIYWIHDDPNAEFLAPLPLRQQVINARSTLEYQTRLAPSIAQAKWQYTPREVASGWQDAESKKNEIAAANK